MLNDCLVAQFFSPFRREAQKFKQSYKSGEYDNFIVDYLLQMDNQNEKSGHYFNGIILFFHFTKKRFFEFLYVYKEQKIHNGDEQCTMLANQQITIESDIGN